MSLCINILFFFFLSSYIHTQVQINFISNLSPSLYLRTLSPSSVYISNHMNHYLYNITSESIEETYLKGSPTSGNDFFPLLISSNNLPSFLIYYDRTFNKIVSYNMNSNNYCDFTIKNTSTIWDIISIAVDNTFIVLYDDGTNFLITKRNRDSCDEIAKEKYVLVKSMAMKYLSDGQLIWFTFKYLIGYDAYFIDPNDLSKIKKDITITAGVDMYMDKFRIIELENKQLMFCYNNNAREYIGCFSAKYDTKKFDIVHKSKDIIKNCDTSNDFFSFYQIRNDQVIVGCGAAPLKMQIIGYDLSKNGDVIIMNLDDYIYFDFTVLDNMSILVAGVQKKESNSYYAFLYEMTVCPKENPINPKQYDLFDFNSLYPSGDISLLFTTLPSVGVLYKDYIGNNVLLNTEYSSNGIYYMITTNGRDSMSFTVYDSHTFQGNKIATAFCNVDIVICNNACHTCDEQGNDDNQLCSSCDNNSGYYRKDTLTGECINYQPYRYFLDDGKEGEKIYKECYTTCETCSDIGDDTVNNCLTCINDYYLDEENLKNCIHKDTLQYYLDKDDLLMKKCYSLCQTCKGEGNNQSHNCSSCINGYSLVEDTFMCTDSLPDNTYYYDSLSNTYIKCFQSCGSCSIKGDEYDNKCITCANGYIRSEENTNICRLIVASDTYTVSDISIAFLKEDTVLVELRDHIKFTFNDTEVDFGENGILYSFDENTLIGEMMTSYLPFSSIFNSTEYHSSSFKYIPKRIKTYDTIRYYISRFGIRLSNIGTITLVTCDDNCKSNCNKLNYCTECQDGKFQEKINTVYFKCVNECDEKHPYYSLNPLVCHIKCPSFTYKTQCVDDCPQKTILKGDRCLEESLFTNGTTSMTIEEIIKAIEDNILEYLDINSTIQGEGFIAQVYDEKTPLSDYENVSSLYLGECENILRDMYNLRRSDQLIIAKFDIEDKSEVTNEVEYVVFDSKGNKLNLSYCNDVSITIDYPITDPDRIGLSKAEEYYNEDGIDIYDSKDPFFNSLCYPYTNVNGNDIIIKDRRTDIYQNVSFCEEDCTYLGVNYTKKKVRCECNKEHTSSIEINNNVKINKEAFEEAIKSVNIFVIKCTELLSLSSIRFNIGFYFGSISILIQIILCINYSTQGIKHVLSQLNKYSKGCPPKKILNIKLKQVRDNKEKPLTKTLNTTCETNNTNKSLGTISSSHTIITTSSSIDTNEPLTTMQMILSQTIIEESPYEKALIIDKRSKSQMFCDFLKEENNLLNSINLKSKFEIISINLSLLLFSLNVDFTLNALFYTDSTISKRYHEDLNFFTDTLRSIYSYLIGFVLIKLISSINKYTTMFELIIKEAPKGQKVVSVAMNYFSSLKRKLVLLFIFEFISMIAFTFYLICFCAVYEGSQKEWFKGGWVSFGISIITSVILSFVLMMLRFLSFYHHSKYLFNLSLYMNNLL